MLEQNQTQRAMEQNKIEDPKVNPPCYSRLTFYNDAKKNIHWRKVYGAEKWGCPHVEKQKQIPTTHPVQKSV